MGGEIITLTREVLAHEAIERKLEGRTGDNRCRSRTNQLGADVDDDISAVFAWIRNRAASDATKRVFLSEVRRLYYWLVHRALKAKEKGERVKALSDLGLEDFEAYREFLRSPPKSWIGRKVPYINSETGLLNPKWHPFEKPLTESHVAHVFAVLKSLFGFLTDMGYLDGNPLKGMRSTTRTQMGDDRARKRKITERALDEEQWSWVLAATESLATTRGNAEYERARFVVRLFYHLGARITEVHRHRMQHFVYDGRHCKWGVVGKGGKYREIMVNSELLDALRRYREHLNTINSALELSPLPTAAEDNPLVFNVYGKKALSTRQIFDVIKELFQLAAEQHANVDAQKASALKKASPHWIRHATASHLALQARSVDELRQVQDHLRHSDLRTTLAYTHVADDAAAAVAERLVKTTETKTTK